MRQHVECITEIGLCFNDATDERLMLKKRVLHSTANQRIWWLSLCFIHGFGLQRSLIVATFSVELRDFLCHFSPIICLWLKIVAKSRGDANKILNFN